MRWKDSHLKLQGSTGLGNRAAACTTAAQVINGNIIGRYIIQQNL